MKKIFSCIGKIFLVFLIIFCPACAKQTPEDPAPTPTTAPTAAATPTSMPTPTAAPTKAPPPKELLEGVLDAEEATVLNTWDVVNGAWCGPAPERVILEEDVDGESQECLYVGFPAELEDWGAGSNVGNVFGVADILEPNKSYKLTVKLKYTDPTKAGDNGHKELMYITCNAAVENAEAADLRGSGIRFYSSDDWQTIEYLFQTGDTFPEDIKEAPDSANEFSAPPFIMVGPSCNFQRAYGEVSPGMELLIAEFSLIEYTPS